MKVLIVEDHPIVSESLINLISSKYTELLCHPVTTGHDGLAYLNGNKADIILLDINLPDMSGIDFCKEATSRHPDLKILVITSIEHRHVVEQAVEHGATGFILKSSDTEEILEAIRNVMAGQAYYSRQVQAVMKGQAAAGQHSPMLTRREVEVLKLIADGLTNQEIAEKLFISAWTVDSHRKNLLVKFDAKNTAQLIKTAVSQGVLDY